MEGRSDWRGGHGVRHFDHLSEGQRSALFAVPPRPVDRGSAPQVLALALGATFYSPGTRPVLRGDARRAALRVLIEGRPPGLLPLLQKLVRDRATAGVAARGLAAYDHPDTPNLILGHYPLLGAEDRPEAINTLVSRPAYARALLKAIAEGRLARGELSAYQARQIHSLGDAALNKQLARTWGEVRGTPAEKRNMGIVFQGLSLFPNLTVGGNIDYGQRIRRRPAAARRKRTEELLEMCGLPGYAERYPHELSGGQQQRVALARAIVNNPAVLLLDEPLGALDLKLRRQMQVELKRIQLEVGQTFVHVTHDQEEAMTMADTVAVMNAGRIEQMGSPAELYELPRTAFVANFLGQ